LLCHFRPNVADTWGKAGSITLGLLDDVLKRRTSFPVVTPRHPFERPARLKVRQIPPDVNRTSPQAIFHADPVGRAVRPADDAALARLRRELDWPQNVRASKRARAIIAYHEGQPIAEIAAAARVSRQTIRSWVTSFERGGVEGWRAYHTSVEHLTSDPTLAARLRAAISAVREADCGTPASNSLPKLEGSSRVHMNHRLQALITRFGDYSVDDLLELAEQRLQTGVGTVYVGDLLAICDELIGSGPLPAPRPARVNHGLNGRVAERRLELPLENRAEGVRPSLLVQ
jgi:hypothetical protein